MKRKITQRQLEEFMDGFERESQRLTLIVWVAVIGGLVVSIVFIAWLVM